MSADPIVEVPYDLAGSPDPMWVRLYAPRQDQPNGDWSCAFEIGAPISIGRTIFGVSSLQALTLGLKLLATYLYGSDAYKNNEIGIYGEFGGHLMIPAPVELLDVAPYPF